MFRILQKIGFQSAAYKRKESLMFTLKIDENQFLKK